MRKIGSHTFYCVKCLRVRFCIAAWHCLSEKLPCFRMYAHRLDVAVIESVVSLIHSQLEHILMSTPTSCMSVDTNSDVNGSGGVGGNNGYINKRELRSVERSLGDFLVFVRRIASSRVLRKLLAGREWTNTLLNILGQQTTGEDMSLPRIQALRPRLLAIQLLAAVLPSLDRSTSTEHREQVRVME